MESLPSELRCLIASFVARQKDLCSLARVCSNFLAPARLVLYEHAYWEISEGITTTLRLISRDRTVALAIKQVTIVAISSFLDWTTLRGIIMTMANLRHMRILRFSEFFRDAPGQESFRIMIKIWCPLLTEFSCDAFDDGLPSPEFGVSGLKVVDWHYRGGKSSGSSLNIESSCISLAQASAATITCLYLGQSLTLSRESLLLRLTQLYFPRLIELNIEDWFSMSIPHITTSFTTFLRRHSKISHLYLGFTDPSWHYVTQLDSTLISDDFLPNLEELKAHPGLVQTLAEYHCRSLKNLKKLDFNFRYEGIPIIRAEQEQSNALSGMLDSLLAFSPSGFPNMEELELCLRYVFHNGANVFVEHMRLFALAFPRLQNWFGFLPRDMPLPVIAAVLSDFERVRQFQIMGWPDPDPISKVDTVRIMAMKCQFLQLVKFRSISKFLDPRGRKEDLVISRDDEGSPTFFWR